MTWSLQSEDSSEDRLHVKEASAMREDVNTLAEWKDDDDLWTAIPA